MNTFSGLNEMMTDVANLLIKSYIRERFNK